MNKFVRAAARTLCVAFAAFAAATIVLGAAPAQATDLKLQNIRFEPKPEIRNGMAVFHMYRSYFVIVEVRNLSLPNPNVFTVRTECHRGAGPSRWVLGEGRVGMTPNNGTAYAAYHIFPSSAGPGQCQFFTVVDANGEVADADRSPASNVWTTAILIEP